MSAYEKPTPPTHSTPPPPPPSSTETLHRTTSDISYELNKQSPPLSSSDHRHTNHHHQHDPTTISEVECECCGMSEECTPEYINRIKDNNYGKVICGLCSEAVKEEMNKSCGTREKALDEHIQACERFNRVEKAYPVFYQAVAMREMLKKSKSSSFSWGGHRGSNNNSNNKSLFVRGVQEKGMSSRHNEGGIARSSSCMPALTQDPA